MPFSPGHQGLQHRTKIAAHSRQGVAESGRIVLVSLSCDEGRGFQPDQTVGKDVGRNALGRGEEFPVASLSPEEVSNHKQRPAVADQIE
jgi:hypothetical protein